MEEKEAPSLDLEGALGDHMLEARRSWNKEGKLYASDLGLALGPEHAGCPLAFWHKCRNAPTKDVDAGRLLLMQAGDLLHDFMADALKMALPIQGWRVVSVETRVFLEHNDERIGSRLDVLIEHMETGWRRVIDVKTKRGNAFSYLREAKPGDVLQVQGYIKATDSDDGMLLYVDREGQNFVRAFHVVRNDKRPEFAIEVLQGIRDQEEPPDPVSLRLKVVENKGPNSFYLNMPWQMEWCDLKKCACAEQMTTKSTPKKIAGKLIEKDDDDGEYTLVALTPEGEPFEEIILGLLHEQFPNTEFVLKKDDA